MKRFWLTLVGITMIGALAMLLIALRNGAFSSHAVEFVTVRGFAALFGLAFALLAGIPLGLRVRRVERTRLTSRVWPVTEGMQRRNRRCYLISGVVLALEVGLVLWWQIFDGGDPVVTTWALGALAICYLVRSVTSRPMEVPPPGAPQSMRSMLDTITD